MAVVITTGGLLEGLAGAVLALPVAAAVYAALSYLAGTSARGGATALHP